jgi:hypothetical protein
MSHHATVHRARLLATTLILGVSVVLGLSAEACGGCHEGTCECADGTKIRVRAAPCDCRGACASHGGVCEDDFAGCSADAGDAGLEASAGGDADAWPWPWDASD